MRDHRIILAAATLGFLLGALPISAQDSQGKPSGDPAPWYSPSRYNPLKLIKRSPQSANDQLAADGDLQKKLTTQLQAQGFLAADQDLQDVCSDFRKLSECVAVLRLSHTLPVDFSCLKWDVTGVKPKRVADSCAGPSGGKGSTERGRRQPARQAPAHGLQQPSSHDPGRCASTVTHGPIAPREAGPALRRFMTREADEGRPTKKQTLVPNSRFLSDALGLALRVAHRTARPER